MCFPITLLGGRRVFQTYTSWFGLVGCVVLLPFLSFFIFFPFFFLGSRRNSVDIYHTCYFFSHVSLPLLPRCPFEKPRKQNRTRKIVEKTRKNFRCLAKYLSEMINPSFPSALPALVSLSLIWYTTSIYVQPSLCAWCITFLLCFRTQEKGNEKPCKLLHCLVIHPCRLP